MFQLSLCLLMIFFYRSEITTQTKNNNLDYLIDPTFADINRLFVLSFKNGDNDATRNSFDKYYML